MASGRAVCLQEGPRQIMHGYWEIIRRNLFSPIVIAIFLLAGALIYAREYRDAWFISVVIVVNSLIGIVQEIRDTGTQETGADESTASAAVVG